MLCPASPELPDPIRDAATRKPSESVEREWRTCPVAHEPLATEIIVVSDPNACVNVEALQLDGATFAGGTIRLQVRWRVDILRERASRSSLDRDGRARRDRREVRTLV